MRKSMLLCLIAGVMVSACEHFPINKQDENKPELPRGIAIIVVDSCEYIQSFDGYGPYQSASIVHKGNCRNHGGKP